MTPARSCGLEKEREAGEMSDAAQMLRQVPGIKFVDHVAIAVKPGELEGQVKTRCASHCYRLAKGRI
jgi:hypothetical protein